MSTIESEFGGRPRKSGELSAVKANEKARIMRRAEKNPDIEDVDLDVPHDKWKHGGVPEYTNPDRWWELG